MIVSTTVRTGAALLVACALSLPAHAQEAEQAGGLPPRTDAAPKQAGFTGGIRFATDYDDNALNMQGDTSHDFISTIQPHFGWRSASVRNKWDLGYSPRLALSHRLEAYDAVGHNVNASYLHAFTRRLAIETAGSYSYSSNPFDRVRSVDSSSTTGLEAAAPSALTPTTNASSAVDVTYMLGRHSTIGVRGEYSQTAYIAPDTADPSFFDALGWRSFGGDVYYSQRFTPRQYASVRYTARQSLFDNGSSALSHRVQYVHTFAVSSKLQISGFAGPEYADLSSLTLPTQNVGTSTLSYSAGANVSFTVRRLITTAVFTRRITESTGAFGPVRLHKGSVSMQSDASRNWRPRVSFEIYDHDPLDGLSPAGRNASLITTVGRRLSNRLWIEVMYWRQQTIGTVPPTNNYFANHNRAAVSLNYEFLGASAR